MYPAWCLWTRSSPDKQTVNRQGNHVIARQASVWANIEAQHTKRQRLAEEAVIYYRDPAFSFNSERRKLEADT